MCWSLSWGGNLLPCSVAGWWETKKRAFLSKGQWYKLVSSTMATPNNINSDEQLLLEPHVYGDEVLGRVVNVKFAIDGNEDDMEFFEGKITGVKKMLIANGEVECEHHVSFEDGDEDWFDLMKEQQNGCLIWIDETESFFSPAAERTQKPSNQSDDDEDDLERDADDEEEKNKKVPAVEVATGQRVGNGITSSAKNSRKRGAATTKSIVTPDQSIRGPSRKKPKSSLPTPPPEKPDTSSEDEEETASEEGFDSPFSEDDASLQDDF